MINKCVNTANPTWKGLAIEVLLVRPHALHGYSLQYYYEIYYLFYMYIAMK